MPLQQSGRPQLIAQQSKRPQLIAQQSGTPFVRGSLPEPGPLLDLPGAAKKDSVFTDLISDVLPSRGFLKEFTTPFDPASPGSTGLFWFPATDADSIHTNAGLEKTKRGGFTQGVSSSGGGGVTFLIFKEAKILDARAETAFQITPKVSGSSNIILKLSKGRRSLRHSRPGPI